MNPQPPVPETGALSFELRARLRHFSTALIQQAGEPGPGRFGPGVARIPPGHPEPFLDVLNAGGRLNALMAA